MKQSQNILLSRIDAIGDVVLSLPVAGILKNLFPDCTIFFLGQTYTKDVIKTCQYIDNFIDWNQIKDLNPKTQIDFFRKLNIDVAIHIYPNFFISWILKSAGIPIRIGTSRRWYHQLFCNKKISFSRRSSNLHEVMLNLKLLIPFDLGKTINYETLSIINGIIPPTIPDELNSLLDKNRFNLIIHPKSKGHGKEWGIENYAKLLGLLDNSRFNFFVTGTLDEKKEIQQEILNKYPQAIDLVGKLSLDELIGFISRADGLVASGTGPLHLAAATGIHAIGLFPPIRPVFSRRWAPVGVNAKAFEAKKICVKCKKNAKCDCLRLFKPEIVAEYLNTLHKPSQKKQLEANIFKPSALDWEQFRIQQAQKFENFVSDKKTKVFTSTNQIFKKNRIIVSVDKINKPNCGLGRVAIDFSKALINEKKENCYFSFILTGNNSYDYFRDQDIKRFKFIHRFFKADFGEYDVAHYLHQTPSFKIKGAKKTILTIHDLNFLYTKSNIKANRYLKHIQRNVDKADAIVFISNFTKEICFQHLQISPEKITRVIYNGVNLPKTIPIKPPFINGTTFIFSIGQFLAKKNFHTLIPFIKLFPSNIQLVIAGEKDTSYGNYVRKLISDYNLQNQVILPGSVSEAEKLYLYQNCEAFVFPSLAEGFGLPVIEAMRAEKPVFCSDKTSLKEIGNGHVFFWESFDPQQMFMTFQNGMKSFDEAKKKSAYEYSMKFTWEENARQYLSLYHLFTENE
ncbi:MAG TPA: glycosyltransferase [Bacteroidales bacterium]|nr:glycosyltransferase [Bacteroidales bacterium]